MNNNLELDMFMNIDKKLEPLNHDVNKDINNKNITGKIIHYYDNGQIKLIGNYNEKGILDGEFTFFYDNGNIHYIGFYINGNLYGDYKKYYKNGKKEEEGKYLNNIYHGEIKNYNELGDLISTSYYINGIIKYCNGTYF